MALVDPDAPAARTLRVVQRSVGARHDFIGIELGAADGDAGREALALGRADLHGLHQQRGLCRFHTRQDQAELQPIIDVGTGLAVGYEALSRFHEGTPDSVFSAAHRDGYGLELEAAALRAALERRPLDGYLWLSLSRVALTSPVVQAALGDDLRGIVIEIGHRGSAEVPDAVSAVVRDLKRRGARIAIADWAAEHFDVRRLSNLAADAVTLNRRSLAALCVDDQRAVMGATVRWAQQNHMKICAGGIETREQWEVAVGLGFDFAEGPYFEQVVPAPASVSSRAAAPAGS